MSVDSHRQRSEFLKTTLRMPNGKWCEVHDAEAADKVRLIGVDTYRDEIVSVEDLEDRMAADWEPVYDSVTGELEPDPELELEPEPEPELRGDG